MGCKAARDLLVQALTQTAGNLWPSARNLRGSELVLDRGIRMAARYGCCWGTRIWIVGWPYWGSFEMLKCLLLPCSTDAHIYLASPTGYDEQRAAMREAERHWPFGIRAVMARETVMAATGYYTEDGPERISPEGSQTSQSGWWWFSQYSILVYLTHGGGDPGAPEEVTRRDAA